VQHFGLLLFAFFAILFPSASAACPDAPLRTVNLQSCTVGDIALGEASEHVKLRLGEPDRVMTNDRSVRWVYPSLSLWFIRNELQGAFVTFAYPGSAGAVVIPDVRAGASIRDLHAKLGTEHGRIDDSVIYKIGSCCLIVALIPDTDQAYGALMIRTADIVEGCSSRAECREKELVQRVCSGLSPTK
jgi:hypothetical protein